jgi:hypothetical protein
MSKRRFYVLVRVATREMSVGLKCVDFGHVRLGVSKVRSDRERECLIREGVGLKSVI